MMVLLVRQVHLQNDGGAAYPLEKALNDPPLGKEDLHADTNDIMSTQAASSIKESRDMFGRRFLPRRYYYL